MFTAKSCCCGRPCHCHRCRYCRKLCCCHWCFVTKNAFNDLRKQIQKQIFWTSEEKMIYRGCEKNWTFSLVRIRHLHVHGVRQKVCLINGIKIWADEYQRHLLMNCHQIGWHLTDWQQFIARTIVIILQIDCLFYSLLLEASCKRLTVLKTLATPWLGR